jgi:hypothetical protein
MDGMMCLLSTKSCLFSVGTGVRSLACQCALNFSECAYLCAQTLLIITEATRFQRLAHLSSQVLVVLSVVSFVVLPRTIVDDE